MKQAVKDGVQQIKHLLRHDKTSIVERHAQAEHAASVNAGLTALREQCMTLLECAGLVDQFSEYMFDLG